ncbi:hypothetical protein R6Q59_006017 [Mikania micrantha]
MAGAFAHGAIFFIRDYNPEQNEDNVLARMLEHKELNPDWLKKSTSGKDNRSKTDRGGKTSRHTGGSIGYDERRLRLAEYLQEMRKEYGLNFVQDDARVWERLRGNGGPKRVFGIGLSDLDFVVTGTSSSSYGSTPSYVDKQAQQKLQDLEARLEIEELEEQMKKMNEFIKKLLLPIISS